MKKGVVCLLILLALAGNISCKQWGKPITGSKEVSREFQLPTVPATISDPQQRAVFLAKNYWQHFDFTDTAYIHLPKITEQAYANYLEVLKLTDQETASQCIAGLMKSAEADSLVFSYFFNLADKYLYEPNSPFYNENLYIPVLETVVNSRLSGEVTLIRAKALLTMALKNRPGSIAADFSYTQGNGLNYKLSGYRHPYTILFLNDIDCENCQHTMKELSQSEVINSVQKKNLAGVLSVYTLNDIEGWRKKLREMPASWTNGYDAEQSISQNELYDLKAMPTLFLLDKDKKVLLKETSVEAIEQYFQSL